MITKIGVFVLIGLPLCGCVVEPAYQARPVYRYVAPPPVVVAPPSVVMEPVPPVVVAPGWGYGYHHHWR